MLVIAEKEDLKKSGVYSILVKGTNLIYIGSSKSIYRRYKEHSLTLKKGLHSNYNLQEYYDKGYTLEISIIEQEWDRIKLREREYFHIKKNERNLLNITKITNNIKIQDNLTKEEIIQISEDYNEGMTCAQISLKMYGTNEYRNRIASLTRGEIYPQFKKLFNYRVYTQKGKKRGMFTCSTKYKGLSRDKKLRQIAKDKEYIVTHIGKLSGRQISKNIGLNVDVFIKEYKEKNEIVWEKNTTKEIKENFTDKYGIKVDVFDAKGNYIETKQTISCLEKEGISNYMVRKSSKTGKPYKEKIFKIVKNEL